MCTWPRGGRREDWKRFWQFGYFNECMSGFEYQAAGHRIREGLVLEGLAIARAIHDRYHPARRNPYNEIECSDHYARAMASYGVFLAACGFEYDGPGGRLAFAPRLRPEDFRAAFTAAEGWGTLWQRRTGAAQTSAVLVRHGRLRLREIGIEVPEDFEVGSVAVRAAGKPIAAGFEASGSRVTVRLVSGVLLEPDEELAVEALRA